ncbi:MAG: flippase [bacterium]|nr:flippase [bacterium]
MVRTFKKLFFGDHSQKGTVVKNFLWLMTSQVGGRVIRSAITIYAARALGTSGYGVFSYAVGLTSFFLFFKNIGVDGIMTREVAHRPAERNQLFATSFWLEVGLLVITAALLLFVAPLFTHIPEALTLIPALMVMFIADDMRDLFVAFFRGIEKMEWEAVVTLASNIALVVFGFGALMVSKSPLYLAMAYAAAALFGVFLAGGIVFIRHIQGFFKSFNKDLVVPILQSAWPIAVGGIVGLFLVNVDIIMLGFWKTTGDVGIYAAIQKIVGILGVPAALVATSMFPMFSRLAHSGDPMRTRQVIESVLRVLFLFAVPLVLGGVVLGAPLLEFIFGAAYISGASAMAILLFSILATFPMVIFTNCIFAYDQQRKTIAIAIITSLVSIGLNFLLIPRLGMIGASFATLMSSVVYSYLTFRLCRKITPFSLWGGFSKIFGAAVPMMVLAWFFQMLGWPVLLNIALSGAVYFAILKLLKERALDEILSLVRSA